jgi:hypothetical protein
MKKGLVGILAVGFMATAANAATLSMRFAGGATEITMGAASDSATIEVLLTWNTLDGGKAPSKISSINARFDVGTVVPGVGGNYVQDTFPAPSKWVVTDTATSVAGWNTDGSSAPGAAFDRSYFFASEDPAGAVNLVGAPGTTVVLGSFTIHKTAFSAGDTAIVFRVEDPLPALSEGPTGWSSRWQYGVELARNNWLMGAGPGAPAVGNPGDADPRWGFHGYESLNPLVIHNVPEPSALALLALGGLAMLRRRN